MKQAVKTPGLMVRLFAFLRGGRVVWLRDTWGETYVSIAIEDAFGFTTAPVYWFTQTGCCILEDDGSVAPQSSSAYVKTWKEAA